MIGFFIKKAFFDGWDNLIGIIIQNVGFVVFLAVGYGAFLAFQVNFVLGLFLVIAALACVNIYVGAVSYFGREYAFYQRPGLKAFLEYIKDSWKISLVHAGIVGIFIIMVFVVIPFYAQIQSIIGAIVIALLFWITLFGVMALFYYLPLTRQLNNPPKKALKKCFLLVFDNIGFSFFLLVYTIVNAVISILTAFLIPGFAAILMSHQIAVKLLMYKYDYLEENPDANRKRIPWSALLIEERECVGHRSLRGMIFPWKE